MKNYEKLLFTLIGTFMLNDKTESLNMMHITLNLFKVLSKYTRTVSKRPLIPFWYTYQALRTNSA